jgi:hypothetical protein
MRYLFAGILSIAVIGLAGTGVIAWDFADRFAACGSWTAGAMAFGLVALLIVPPVRP